MFSDRELAIIHAVVTLAKNAYHGPSSANTYAEQAIAWRSLERIAPTPAEFAVFAQACEEESLHRFEQERMQRIAPLN